MTTKSLTATAFTPIGSVNHVVQSVLAAKATFSSVTGLGATNSISVSDRVWMVPLPSNCVVLDGYVSGHIDNDATVVKVGAFGPTGTMSSTLATLLTFSATPTLKRFFTSGGNAGAPVTMSAAATIPSVFVGVEVTSIGAGSATTTVSLVMVLYYATKGFV